MGTWTLEPGETKSIYSVVPTMLTISPSVSRSDVHLSAQIFDRSRAAHDYGVEVPLVAPESFAPEVTLVCIAESDAFRVTLRVYELDASELRDALSGAILHQATIPFSEALSAPVAQQTTLPIGSLSPRISDSPFDLAFAEVDARLVAPSAERSLRRGSDREQESPDLGVRERDAQRDAARDADHAEPSGE